MIVLTPGEIRLAHLEQILASDAPVALSPEVREAVEASAARIAEVAAGDEAVYGINTGFGKLAAVRIPNKDMAILQRKLILSHCAGMGEPLNPALVRLVMSLKLASLGRGASGVRWAVIESLEGLLAANVIPRIPAQGSVGASGDLAPLAHLAAVMIGEGEALYEGRWMTGREALAAAELPLLELGPKEGLALINGTQVSTALALDGLFRAWRCAEASLVTGALSTDAAMGSATPFIDGIHALRGHAGQREAAALLRRLLELSGIRASHSSNDERVQDPYCLRCQPQVLGACIDVLRHCAGTLLVEANAATDNPLVLDDGSVVSGGNFHAEPVAFAADQMALAIAEMGSIAQRRISLLVDPSLSHGLPAFLTPEPGLNSGLMVAEVTSAALMSENRQLASPASVDSTPTSANQEDHVSMACHAARRLHAMTENLGGILGIEALCGAQGVELRAPLVTAPPLLDVIARIREVVPTLEADRYLANDLAVAREMILSEALLQAAGIDDVLELESA